MLIAFNAAPGTVAPAENGSYGAYAQALAEMIREGGLSPSDVFDGVRLRVNEVTKGGQVPWDASRISAPFVFFERAADAPPPALAQDKASAMRSRPLQDLGAQDAYAAAIERDTLEGYEEFLAAYPSDPLANRIRGLVAARREAMTWRQTRVVNTPDAYWSYLDRYPRGPHAADAHRRLASFGGPCGAASRLSRRSVTTYRRRRPRRSSMSIARCLSSTIRCSASCRRRQSSSWLLRRLISSSLPPPPPIGLFVLPVPAFVPFPVWVNSPAYVVPPPENVVFNNIHNTTIINNNNTVSESGRNARPHGARHARGGWRRSWRGGRGDRRESRLHSPSVARKATMTGGGNSGFPGKPPGQAAPGLRPGTAWIFAVNAIASPRLAWRDWQAVARD